MKSYPSDRVRNVALIGHGGAGKTTLTEALLFRTGAITRQGKVEEGNTVADYDPDEVRRRISISLALAPLEWRDHKINLLDTPGYLDFVGEAHEALRVAEAAVLVVDAVSGVQVGSELTWKIALEQNLPRIIFINKIDRENANFDRTVEQIRAIFGPQCVPVQVPIGAHDSFQGVVDLIGKKARLGPKSEEGPLPASIEEDVQRYREMLIEAAAEGDDELITEFLEGVELSPAEIARGIRELFVEGRIVPILVGSAATGKAVSPLLDAILDLVPSPVEKGAGRATSERGETPIAPSAEEPLAALVFKTAADPFVGKLTYFRVYSGVLKADSHVINSRTGHDERIGSVFVLRGKTQEAVPVVAAGDIGVVTKLADTGTGDTLCAKERVVALPGISFPEPWHSVAVAPKSKADVDKMGQALARLAEEDRTLRVSRQPDTGETIVSGIGETHIDVALEKLKRKFGAELIASLPKVPYKETITTKTTAEYKHKKQTGGHGQYGHVHLEFEPLERGAGIQFAERVVGGAVPRNFYPAVEKGVMEAAAEGVLSHNQVVDVRITLYDGSYHAVDSSEIAFKLAAAQAFKKGVLQARPVLLEPVMAVEITAPESAMGDILSDINTRRARVLGMNTSGGVGVVEAHVPLAEMLRYAIELRSITGGRGSFTMRFDHYDEAPQHIAQAIIAEAKKQYEAAHA